MPVRHPFHHLLRDASRLWRGSTPRHTDHATTPYDAPDHAAPDHAVAAEDNQPMSAGNGALKNIDWRMAGSARWSLEKAALSPTWTAPVGGSDLLDGTLRRTQRRVGRGQASFLSKLPRLRDEQLERETQQALTELAHQAAQLAEHMALIVMPGMRVRWASDPASNSDKRSAPAPRNGPREANAPHVGDIVLDPALLRPRPGWDTAHRLDAVMGRVLHDAAHSRYTPADFRAELARAALHSAVFAASALPDEEVPILPPALLVLFLLVEDVTLNSWLCASFPGFRGYLDAASLWTIPASEVQHRRKDAERAISPASLLALTSAVLSHRMTLQAIPAPAGEIVTTLCQLARQIEPDARPADRYALALTLYAVLRDFLRQQSSSPHRMGDLAADNNQEAEATDDPLVRRAQPSLADETADRADQQALQDLLALIAQDRLDPQAALAQAAQRERALPEQRADLEEPGAAAVRRAVQRDDDDGGDDETEILTYGKIAMPSQTVVTLLTPAVTQSARSRYRQAHYATRPQIAALRQALRFKLAERRHLLRARSSGLIDEQALYRLPSGDERVFMHRGIESAPDQDLCILLDESASMGAKQRHVREVAVLFHHALADLPGVRHWVFGFSAFGSQCTLYRYVSPQRPDLQQAERLGAISARQGTPLAEAVAGAAEQMLREGQGRHRLMIVVTDGEPDDQRSARDALRDIAAHGISVLGIGVADSAVPLASLFPHFILSTDLPGLPRKLGNILKAAIGVEGPAG